MKTSTPTLDKPRSIADDLEEIVFAADIPSNLDDTGIPLILSSICEDEVGSCSDSFFQLN